MTDIGVDHPVGEALATDTNAFKHAVTSKLVHDESRVDHTCREGGKKGMVFRSPLRARPWGDGS
ncbi:hypothetical protein E2C01_092635 [Portunus trituberculatus]|uniref:Uncharacterized protein n=1 Tax=Portunus trituberculatus TaxID=210409 RepID=A0A5B7JY95_PORTR|nr:hypothetical protein [Portunus trituberculatus]